MEVHTAEKLVPEPGPFEVETAIGKFETYKSQGINQILVQLIPA
jgi:hypothetical protein